MALKILYVEDNPTNMRLIRRILDVTDYQLLEAIDGKGGIEVALKEIPDLILMDINLPDKSGVSIIHFLKQSPTLQHIPVVALTADNDRQTIQNCLVAGCATVLNKPISPFLLLDTIRRFTDSTITQSSMEKNTLTNDSTTLKNVLIVDDNPDLRTIFARAFDRRHFSVHVAVDGVEAIESLEAELPDVLILDINMPRLSGFDVLRYVRQNQKTKDIKVVVVTGNSMAIQSPEAEYADLLLVKPINISDLVTLAQRLIPANLG